MGTRSLIFVHEDAYNETDDLFDQPVIVCIYQQYDGYFDGVGQELKNFLAGSMMVNGIGMNEVRTIFNGAGDLAARLITEIKQGDSSHAGGAYIYPPDTKDDDAWAEYAYHVYSRIGEEPYIIAIRNADGGRIEGYASQIDFETVVAI